MGIGRSWRAVALVAVGAAGGGAAIAAGAIGSDNTINACVEVTTVPGSVTTAPLASGPNVRILGTGQSCNTAGGPAAPQEQAINWNVAGAPGATGATGPQGPAGNVVTISGGSFSIGSGRTATFSSPPTLAPFTLSGNTQPIGTLTLSGAGGAADARAAAVQISSNVFSGEIVSWGFTNQVGTGTGRGGGGGGVKLGDLHIVKVQDSASVKLQLDCVTGKHFPKAVLYVRKSGGGLSLTVTLSHVTVTSYQAGGKNAGDGRPLESLTLAFTKVDFQYTKQGDTPSTSRPITTIVGRHI